MGKRGCANTSVSAPVPHNKIYCGKWYAHPLAHWHTYAASDITRNLCSCPADLWQQAARLFSGSPDTETKLMAYIRRFKGRGSGGAHTKSERKGRNGQSAREHDRGTGRPRFFSVGGTRTHTCYFRAQRVPYTVPSLCRVKAIKWTGSTASPVGW